MLRYYFAYGSNMNPARMRRRELAVMSATRASLADFELRFNKVSAAHPAEAHANVARRAGATVEGVLYELAGPDEIEKMDPFEKAGVNYSREAVVVVAGGPRWAWTYFANPGVIRAGLRPTRWYLDHLLAGAQFLSPSYLRVLAETPTLDVTIEPGSRDGSKPAIFGSQGDRE